MKIQSAIDLVLESREGLTFDDVTLIPEYSYVKSRKDVSTKTKLCGNLSLSTPLIPANMDTITGPKMARCCSSVGSIGFLHRFSDRAIMLEEFFANENTDGIKKLPLLIGLSIGLSDSEEYISELVREYWRVSDFVFLLDVANAHNEYVLKKIDSIKKDILNTRLIVGNVATPEAVISVLNSGADGVKIGIGNGGLCETRLRTGVGVPQFSAIALCANAINEWKNRTRSTTRPCLIADGGIRYPGDIMKALGAGADLCMSGYLFAGTQETPGRVIRKGLFPNEVSYKVYRGSASASSKNDRSENSNIEGNAIEIPMNGSAKYVFQQVKEGIQSGLSYCGYDGVQDFIGNGMFARVSQSSIIEAQPHAMRRHYESR